MNNRYFINVSVQTHKGNVRENHEDNFLLPNGIYLSAVQLVNECHEYTCFYQSLASSALFAVSDGMGGHQAGEVASFLAVSKLNKARKDILSASCLDEAVNRYQEYMNILNREIVTSSLKNGSLKGMGATLSTLILHNGQAAGIQIGDSRIYQFQKDRMEQITKDHTEGQRMLDLHLLTDEEVKRFPSSKELTRYLGMGHESLIMTGETSDKLNITEKVWFLLCSDGLTDVVADQDIEFILKQHFHKRNVEEAVKTLVNMALQDHGKKKGGTDNITVMIAEILPV